MNDITGSPRKKKTKLSIRIATIAAIIAALATVVANLGKLVDSTKDLLNSIGILGKVCTAINCDISVFSEIPYALNRTIKERHYRNKTDLYWFLINARNKCFYKGAEVHVKFEVSGNQEFKESASIFNQVCTIFLNPRESSEVTVDPMFQLNNPDLEGYVDVTWKVTVEGSDATLDGGTIRLKVLPRKIFPWNWEGPKTDIREGTKFGEVNKELIIASLAAWTLDRDNSVKKLSNKITKHVNLIPNSDGPLSYGDKWIAHAIELLFSKKEDYRIAIIKEFLSFPDRREITIPRQIIRNLDTEIEIDGLEAALLLCSLSCRPFAKRGIRMVLILSPRKELSSKVKECYIAWTNINNKSQAININNVLVNFEKNKSDSKAILQRIYEKPEVQKELEKDGIYWVDENSFIVIDLKKASEEHGIKGLI
ncbi:MAG: hypothetical protein JSW07_02905 [bacterium]|nr:MAG: hypothetical protein JSW07_02905 [bacterium]